MEVEPCKEHGRASSEGPQREDIAVTEPANVAHLLKLGLCSSDNTRGVASLINGEPFPILAKPDLVYLEKGDEPNRVYTTVWCL